MPRNRRLDQALGTSKRSVRIATGLIVAVGAVILFWFFSPGERTRRDLVGRLETGDLSSRVTAVLGPPGARCPAGDLSHLRESFPPGWPAASLETALQTLAGETAERWVYPLDDDDPAQCAGENGTTEIGIDAEGRILWSIAIIGETRIELPDRFTPATPTD
ncbi:MAG TPA: hypothetical protein VFZ18_05225 [Longimicrobiaceae bacterium]